MSADIRGNIFGRLTANHPTDERRFGKVVWECSCNCGNTVMTTVNHLRSGNTTSCGCFRAELTAKRSRTHGATSGLKDCTEFPRTYRIWLAMRRRCYDQKMKSWHNYGGRGIKVCSVWNGSYEAFLLDMGECPAGMSIDRYPDSDGDYEPGNCRWATPAQQARNCRGVAFIDVNGERLRVPDACAKYGVNLRSLKVMASRNKEPHAAVFARLLRRNEQCAVAALRLIPAIQGTPTA